MNEANLKLADELQKLCCAETEGKFFDLVTDSIGTILAALRAAPPSVALKAGPSVEDIARTICLSYGRDPDGMTSALEMCDANNRPVAIWHVYEEQAEAILAAYPAALTRPQPDGAETDDKRRQQASMMTARSGGGAVAGNEHTVQVKGMVSFDDYDAIVNPKKDVPNDPS